MKITKYGFSEAESIKAKANVGCNVCPNCGENKSDIDYMLNPHKSIWNRGIMYLGYYNKSKGLIKMTTYRIDCYKCLDCNTEWKSEPYNIYDERKPKTSQHTIDTVKVLYVIGKIIEDIFSIIWRMRT